MTRDRSWQAVRERRMSEPGAEQSYRAAKLAFEFGAQIRRLRTEKDWTQQDLATKAGMTQSAVARFEAGGTIPTIPVLDRLANALTAELNVTLRSPETV